MLRDVWTKTLWDQRRSLLGWSIGFAAVSLIYAGFFPVAATPEYEEIIGRMPPGFVDAFGWEDISTPSGYLGSTVYGLLGSVLIAVMAIGLGARAIAGSEEDGGLEMLISMPVTRTKVVVHKSIALLVATFMAGVVVFLAVLAIREPLELDIPMANLAAASLNLALLGGLFGTFAILIGSISGKRGLAIGAGAGVAVFAFLVDGLAPQLDSIAWMQKLSPFYWFDATGTLKDGLVPAMTLLLAGVTFAFVIAAIATFNRRDVLGS